MSTFMKAIHKTNLPQDIKKSFEQAEKAAGDAKLHYTYMNHHLQLLHGAILSGDKEREIFHKARLKELRQILMELEYFNMNT